MHTMEMYGFRLPWFSLLGSNKEVVALMFIYPFSSKMHIHKVLRRIEMQRSMRGFHSHFFFVLLKAAVKQTEASRHPRLGGLMNAPLH